MEVRPLHQRDQSTKYLHLLPIHIPLLEDALSAVKTKVARGLEVKGQEKLLTIQKVQNKKQKAAEKLRLAAQTEQDKITKEASRITTVRHKEQQRKLDCERRKSEKNTPPATQGHAS